MTEPKITLRELREEWWVGLQVRSLGRQARLRWLFQWRHRLDDLRWRVRQWSENHPPQQVRLRQTVLTSDERREFVDSDEYFSTLDSMYDWQSEDRAVATWLLARGEGHRVPSELREAVKISLDPEDAK